MEFLDQESFLPPKQDAVLSVSQLTSRIKDMLEGRFSRITLEGEISNLKPASTGHLYFYLKDENAVISAVMFKGRMRGLPMFVYFSAVCRAFRISALEG